MMPDVDFSPSPPIGATGVSLGLPPPPRTTVMIACLVLRCWGLCSEECGDCVFESIFLLKRSLGKSRTVVGCAACFEIRVVAGALYVKTSRGLSVLFHYFGVQVKASVFFQTFALLERESEREREREKRERCVSEPLFCGGGGEVGPLCSCPPSQPALCPERFLPNRPCVGQRIGHSVNFLIF